MSRPAATSTPDRVSPGDDQEADEAAIREAHERAVSGAQALKILEASVERVCWDAAKAVYDAEARADGLGAGPRQATEELLAMRAAMREPLSGRRANLVSQYYEQCAKHFQRRYGLRIEARELGDEPLEFSSLEGDFEGYVQRVTDAADLRGGLPWGTSIRRISLEGEGLSRLGRRADDRDAGGAPERPDPERYFVPVSEMRLRLHRAMGEMRPRAAAVRQLVQRAGHIRPRYGKTWADFDGCFERTYGRSTSPEERFMAKAPNGWLPEVGRMVGQFVRVREAIREDRDIQPTALPVPPWAQRRRYELGLEELPGGGAEPHRDRPRSVTGFSVYRNGKCRIHFADEVELLAFADYYSQG